jgi:hypothetical protein
MTQERKLNHIQEVRNEAIEEHERNETMSEREQEKNETTTENLPTIINNSSLVNNNDDGFDDYADGYNSIIRGTRLKYTKTYEWLTKDGETIQPNREFLLMKIIRVVQKWAGGKPETRILTKEEPFPDVTALNDAAPPHEWRESFGKKKGPYENAFVVYLLDPHAMQAFTFPTATAGGFRAVRELKDRIRVARKLQGPNLYPLVKLTHVHMPTQYGGLQRPHFEVERYVPIDGGGEGEPQLAPLEPNGPSPQLTHSEAKPEPTTQPMEPATKPTVQTALDTFVAKKAEAKNPLHPKLNDKIPF